MTRFLGLLVLFFILGGLIALGTHAGSGYALLRFGHWEAQTSLVTLIIAVILVAIIVYVLVHLILLTWGLPSRFSAWHRERRHKRARHGLMSGFLQLYEGRWNEAETRISRHAEASEDQLLGYLAAADAAHVQEAWSRRDEYLRKAYRREKGSGIATLLTQARLEMDQRQYARARATLKRLGEVASNHPRALALQARLYQHLEDWEQLRTLLPRLEQRGALSRDERVALKREVFRNLLHADSVRGDAQQLRTLWSDMPRNLRDEAEFSVAYAHLLAAVGASEEAASVAAAYLKREWNPALALLYGRLAAGEAAQQLTAAEQWLKRYGEKPELLLMAGVLCLRNRLWGRARSYLWKSLESKPTAEAYMALGDLCHQVGEEDEARQAYRNGLELALPTA